jgi:4'-phosphopantetheinyl transferase EntD
VAIASTARYRGIGLDIEKINRVVPSTWPTILHPTELRQLRTLPEPEQTAFAARIFSAKEAVYKALAPLCAPEELPGFQTSLIHFKEDRFSLECENQRFLQNVSGWTGSVTDFVVNLVFLRAWRK